MTGRCERHEHPNVRSCGRENSTRTLSDADVAAIADALAGRERLALCKREAAARLGVSREFFDEHLAGELPVVRRGRRLLYPVAGLEAWLEREASPL